MGQVISLFNNQNGYTPKKVQTANEDQDQLDHGKKIFEAARPQNAVAVIIATLEEKDYDAHTDYSGRTTKRKLILAWSPTTRRNFNEMRKAAATFEPTRFLAEGDNYKAYEHKEDYTGGGGYYLATERHCGWQVYKQNIEGNLYRLYPIAAQPENFLVVQTPASTEVKPEETTLPGLKPAVRRNYTKKGIEMRFTGELSQPSKQQLRDKGWNFSRRLNLYYITYSDAALEFANSFTAQPVTTDPAAGMIQANEDAYFDTFCQENGI